MAEPLSPPMGEMLVVDSPYEVARWRPLLHPIMWIPHAIIVGVLRQVAIVVGVIYWVILLFTGRLQPGMYGFIAMYERYSTRSSGFLVGYTERYAPFDFNHIGPRDNGAYPPVRLNLPEVPEQTPRSALANFILAVPHYLVLVVYFVAAVVVFVIAWFAVLFTGRWPQGLRDFVVKVGNYYYRVWAYVLMVDTRYPRFGV